MIIGSDRGFYTMFIAFLDGHHLNWCGCLAVRDIYHKRKDGHYVSGAVIKLGWGDGHNVFVGTYMIYQEEQTFK